MADESEWEYEDCDTVTLEDESGEEHEFEILDAIETDDARYLALMPLDEDPETIVQGDGELLITRVEEDDEGEVLCTIEDDEEFHDILSIFEERLSDLYEIDSEDE